MRRALEPGYAAGYAMRAFVENTLKPDDAELSAGRFGKHKIIAGSQTLLSEPIVFTKENVDKFKFQPPSYRWPCAR